VPVELHPEALAELRAAAIWYDEQRPGLGDQLVERAFSTLRRVEEDPDSFVVWTGTASAVPIRKALIDRFPYALAFQTREGRTFVLAFAHTRRRPLYWLSRAGS
jgi:hypothetical protein